MNRLSVEVLNGMGVFDSFGVPQLPQATTNTQPTTSTSTSTQPTGQQPMVMPTMDLTDGAPKKTSALVYLGVGALVIGAFLMLRGKRPALAGLGCSGGRGLGCHQSALGALWRKGGIDRMNRPWYMVVPMDVKGRLREKKVQVGTLADTLKAAKVEARRTGHDIEVCSRTTSGRGSTEKFTVGPE